MNKNKWLYSGTGYVRQAAKKGGSIKHYFWVKLTFITEVKPLNSLLVSFVPPFFNELLLPIVDNN